MTTQNQNKQSDAQWKESHKTTRISAQEYLDEKGITLPTNSVAKKDRTAIVVSLSKKVSMLFGLLCVVSLGLVAFKGFQYGIDFSGGTLIDFSVVTNDSNNSNNSNNSIGSKDSADAGQSKAINLEEAGKQIKDILKTDQIILQPSSNNSFSLKIPVLQKSNAIASASDNQNNESVDMIKKEIITIFAPSANSSISFNQVESIGPQVSKDLVKQSGIAIAFSMCAICLYLIIRFNWKFAVVGVTILAQDVIMAVGFVSLFNLEIGMTMIAALLTIIGYCINDTVVLYDRIRTNLNKYGSTSVGQVIYKSVVEVLRRSIITSLVTSLSLVGIFFFADSAIRGFAIIVIVGIVVGTLGSIFVAPYLLAKIKLTRSVNTKKVKNPMFYAS